MDMIPVRLVLFILLTCILLGFSWRSLGTLCAHGFYRFFVFEGVLFLLLHNHPYWFDHPFSSLQCLSWFLLAMSILFVILGFSLLKRCGGSQPRCDFPANHTFENTVNLVEHGVYRYVRHPMYSSLLFLAWGACLKQLTTLTLSISIAVTLLLFVTARVEEGENCDFFGERYHCYIKNSKMFIPYFF
ncbi:MAG: isoprenylcysteine carboxylmethyltransferase family protein [Desulfuromonas sp.]|nr:isoprenylcysteine carboxylmethyltransferase family protein [Desulfuromonas sp.]